MGISKVLEQRELYWDTLHPGNCPAGYYQNNLSQLSVYALGSPRGRELGEELLLACHQGLKGLEATVLFLLLPLPSLGDEFEFFLTRPEDYQLPGLQCQGKGIVD